MANKVVKMDDKKKQKIDFDGFITKIRIDKKSDIPEIHFKRTSSVSEGVIIENGTAKPLDDFLRAMQALSDIFCEICEFDEDKKEGVIITTVNFSAKGGVIISGQVELTENGIPQPLCVNTPHILIEDDGHGGYSLPDYAKKQLEELKRQAVLYLSGETKEKQQSLFEASNG